MTTEPTPQRVTFSSPALRARVHLLATLRAVDELERAWANRDYWTARHYAATARASLALTREAWEEAEAHTNVLEGLEPPAPADVPPGLDPADLTWLDSEPEELEELDERAAVARARDLGLPPETEAEARAAYGDR